MVCDSDQALLAAVARTDSTAFDELYRRYERRVHGYLRSTVRDEAMTEDLVVDTMTEVWRAAGRFQSRSQVSTWILGIARHKAIDAIRKRAGDTPTVADRHLVREALSAFPGPSRDLRTEVLGKISNASAAGPRATPLAAESRGGWRVWPLWRAGMALAAALILVQFGVILRLAHAPAPPHVMTRGLGSPTTRLQVLVDPGATQAALRDLLRSLHARIVDGPSADGAYVVEIATADPGQIDEDLARARAESQLSRAVKVIQ